MKSRAVLWLLLLALCAGCTGEPEHAENVIALIGEREILRDELAAYLEVNLLDDAGAQFVTAEQQDIIRSRLFDAFFEEQMLIEEAGRNGIEVDDLELAAYLEAVTSSLGDAEEAGERTAPREVVRDTLIAQKYTEIFLSREVRPTPAQIDTYLEQHREQLAPEQEVVLRALMLESPEQAERVYQRLRRRNITFNEAVVAYGTTPGQGIPIRTAIDQQPEPLREALGALRVGQTTRPIDLHGDIYLFRLEARSLAGGAPDALRARAEEELRRELRDRALQRLFDTLRARADVKIVPEHLPFSYKPELASP